MKLDGEVALISGGARGMGETHARALLAEGAKVVIADILDEQGEALAAELGADAVFVHLDVTSEACWSDAIAAAEGAFGAVTVLVNNAGIAHGAPLEQYTLDMWNAIIAVNQTGVFLGMRAFVPAMQAQKSGSIINVSSIWGNAAVPGAHAYHATKGAVAMMSKNAAITYVGDGIRVNSLHPGFIDTPLTQAQDPGVNAYVVSLTPMKRAGTPREIANGALFLASDEASFMTGSELVIDGGYLAQ